ncbi:MAG: dihydrolipoamide acetyltransferase family protein [Chloroflexi bacterium]|nr:dihydrolipoamide acetyltransferase family protein [Chloroflexota bacterium]
MAVRIVMPRLGDFMTEGIVARWAKAQGDAVTQGELIAEIESEKLNYELEAASDGIMHHAVDEGATVGVDDVIGYLLAEGEEPPQERQPTASAVAAPSPAAPQRRASSRAGGDVVPSTPGARRLASNLGVDISQVTPTGPRGRVVDADVRAYHEAQQAAAQPKAPQGMPEPSKIEPLRGIRRAIAQNMRDSLSGTAQLSYFLEVDVTDAQSLRREASRESGVSITMASVLIKACAESLKRVPALNSILIDDNVMYFDEVNMGVAVALDEGLIVPVLKGVQDMTVPQIAEGVQQLSEKARAGTLSSSEIGGGTFTISVLGVVDGFTPILNPPQNALLGVGRSVQKPVVRRGEIVVREMMTLSLTGDHQVIDGAIAASFFRRLQQLVERPAALFR